MRKVAHPWTKLDTAFAALAFLLQLLFFLPTMLPGKTLYGSDSFYQAQVFWMFGERFFLEHWRLPMWNPFINSGMPYLASLSGSLSPYDWLLMPLHMLLDLPHATYLVVHLAFGTVMMYLFLGYLGLRRWSCVLGALLFGFNNYMVSRIFPGHGGKICVLVLLPLGMYFLSRAIRERRVPFFCWFAITIGVQYLQRHPQILFYCLIAYTLYFLYETLPFGEHAGRWELFQRLVLVGGICGGLGLGLTAVELLPQYEYKRFTLRGKEGQQTPEQKWAFNTSWSLPPEELINLAVRNPFGWESDRGEMSKVQHDVYYRGRMQARQAYEYLGVLPLLLAFAAVFLNWRRRETRFFAFLVGFTLLLAFGKFTPLYALACALFPPFTYFRVPIEFFSVTAFAFVVLSALGMDRLEELTEQGEAGQPPLRRFLLGSAVATAAWFVVFGGMYLARSGVSASLMRSAFVVNEVLWRKPDDIPQRLTHLLMMALQSGGLLVVSVALLAGLVVLREARKRAVLLALLTAFAVADLWSFNDDFILAKDKEDQEELYKPIRAIPWLLKDDSLYRIFSHRVERFPNEYMVHEIPSLGGYHAIPLHYYSLFQSEINMANRVTDLLGGKYLILPNTEQFQFNRAQGSEVWRYLERYRLRHVDTQYLIYESTTVMPRAALISAAGRVQSHQAAIQAVTERDFRPEQMVLLAEDLPQGFSLPASPAPMLPATVSRYEPELIEVTLDAPHNGLLLFSEVWYPGWQAEVDGKPGTILRANGLFRAVPVSAGTKQVVLRFKPLSHLMGKVISASCLLALLGIAFVAGPRSSQILPAPPEAPGHPAGAGKAQRKGKKHRQA